MKKIISVIIAAIMMISALATVAAIAASATDGADTSTEYPEVADGKSAAVEGFWNAYAGAGAYLNDDGTLADYNTIPSNSNVPGIRYTEDGFQAFGTYNKNRGGETQRFNIMSTQRVNLKDGFTMKVRVDDFNYEASDKWFSFSIWDSENIAQGDNTGTFGNGYTSLIRPVGKSKVSGTVYDGLSAMESWISDQSYYNKSFGLGNATKPATFGQFGTGNITREYDYVQPNGKTYHWTQESVLADGFKNTVMDENGNAYIEIKLTWDEDFGYNLTIAGISVNPIILNHYLSGYNGFVYDDGAEYFDGDARFADGYAYIGFSIHSAGSDSPAAATILDYNGEKPTGTESRSSICNKETFGDMIDTSGYDANAPILSITSTEAKDYKEVGKFPGTSNLTYTTNKDGTFTIKPGIGASYVMLQPNLNSSYSITNYPVFAVILKDYCTCIFGEGESGCKGNELVDLYLCSGNVLAASDTYKTHDTYFDTKGNNKYIGHMSSDVSADGHDYKVFIFDFNEIAKDWTESDWNAWNARIHKIQVIFNYEEALTANEGQNHFGFCYAGFFQNSDAAATYTADYVRNVKKCEHKAEYLEQFAATVTCTTPGSPAGTYCSWCGMWKETVENADGSTSETWKASRSDIERLGHDLSAATCESPATCQREGCTYTTGEALGHSYEQKSDATKHWEECVNGCGDKKNDAAHDFNGVGYCATCTYQCEHTTTEHKTDAPTCTVSGAEYDLCANCGAQLNKTSIKASGHQDEIIPKKDATCTEAGYAAHKKCKVCGRESGKKEIAAKGHTGYAFDDDGHWVKCTVCGVEDANNKAAHDGKPCSVCGYGCEHEKTTHYETAATCVTAGKKYDKCDACGYEKNVEIIPATGEHSYNIEKEGKAPTCTEAGYTAKEVCSVCGAVNESEELSATGHTEVEIPAVEATCTTNGKSKGIKCKDCGETIVEQTEIPASGHTWVEATCTAPKTCSVCGATEGEALGHKWSEVSCAAPKTCSVCGATEGEALAHTWVDATCTTPKTCSVCGATEGEALGHQWVEATCTVAKHCSVCEENDGLAPGHSYDDKGVCSVCGDKKEVTTQKPEENTKNEQTTTKKDNTSTSNKKKGCGSVAGLSAIAISATVALAGVVCMKKKKD